MSSKKTLPAECGDGRLRTSSPVGSPRSRDDLGLFCLLVRPNWNISEDMHMYLYTRDTLRSMCGARKSSMQPCRLRPRQTSPAGFVSPAACALRQVLQDVVRSELVAEEYPKSVARMYSWTPDECIPEFYTEPGVFRSAHGGVTGLPDLEVSELWGLYPARLQVSTAAGSSLLPRGIITVESCTLPLTGRHGFRLFIVLRARRSSTCVQVPPWCDGSPEDFIRYHRSVLEGERVSRNLHRWLDITFGYCLKGQAAVDNKNVPLPPGGVSDVDVPTG